MPNPDQAPDEAGCCCSEVTEHDHLGPIAVLTMCAGTAFNGHCQGPDPACAEICHRSQP